MTIRNITKEVACCNFCEKDSIELPIHTFLIGSKKVIEGMSPNNPHHVCQTCLDAFGSAIYDRMYQLTRKRRVLITGIEGALEDGFMKADGKVSKIEFLIREFKKHEQD